MEYTLDTLAQHLNGRVIGNGAMLIRGINSAEAAQEDEITFAEDQKHLVQALRTKAAAVIVSSEINELEVKSGISVQNPRLAFALALDLFHPSNVEASGVHPTAVLATHVQLSEGVSIGPHAVVGHDVCIGRGTRIESGVHLGDGVTVGEECWIGPNVVLYRQTHLGHRVRIHGGSVIGGDGFGYVFHNGHHVKVPQVGNVVIEDDVEIGCNVCVDRATIGSTVIKRGTKIDNLVQIGHNNRIGEHVIIAGQGGFSGSVTVGNYAVFGGRAGIADHVTIGEKAQIGLCSVVTKSVAPGEIVFGYPARPIRDTKRQMASFARMPSLIARLGDLVKRMLNAEERLTQLEHPTTSKQHR